MAGPSNDEKALAAVYAAVDAVKAADVALNNIPFGVRPALETLFDQKIYPCDLDALAKAMKRRADEWSDEISAATAPQAAALADRGA